MFQGYREGPIAFDPTFKFDPQSDVYDTSAKARVPAWCDRILVKADALDKGLLGQRVYECVEEARHSDHRAVFAVYDVNCSCSNSST